MNTAAIVEERLQFDSEGVSLEGILAYPEEGRPDSSVLLLAPHPHFGGNMENNVIRHVGRRAAEVGCATLRFNYRGVGNSELELRDDQSPHAYWAALEEQRRYDELLPDVSAAWKTLQRATGGAGRSVLLGYSLGAVLAGMFAADTDVSQLIALSAPVAKVPLDVYRECHAPKLFINGDNDFAFDSAMFDEAYAALPEPKGYILLKGSDHFFRKEEERVFEHIRAHLLGF